MRSGGNPTLVLAASGLLTLQLIACSRPRGMTAAVDSSVMYDAGYVQPDAGRTRTAGAASTEAPDASYVATEERILSFQWKPRGGSTREYSMDDPRDQHRVVLPRGLEHGKPYPVVVAMHGQPRRGQAPRSYRFLQTVSDVARELIASKVTPPFVLVTPVFRFEAQNWPHFDLIAFMAQVRALLRAQDIDVAETYVFGHSGAAGCGGQGLNEVAMLSPAAVGFFDTCVGAGFQSAVTDLSAHRVPTFIAHSVETAGFHPRQPVEYDAHFDFGRVYSRIGLRPSQCPHTLPAVPLRNIRYRCASNDAHSTLALVLDTGVGEQAHEALLPVAMRYFIGQYVKSTDR